MRQLGRRLFGETGAERFIERFEGWLRDNGLYQSLPDLDIHPDEYSSIADYAVTTYGDGRQLNAAGPLERAQIVEIFALTERQSELVRP